MLGFEVDNGFDFMIVSCMLVIASLWYIYVSECCIIYHTCCKWDTWITIWHELLLDCVVLTINMWF